MAASCDISENTVKYKLFPLTHSDNKTPNSDLEIISEEYISKLCGFLHRYIWQNDSFNLHVINDGSSYLEGITCFGDNVEDEWFIVYLLYYLSERDNNLIIQVQDNDGEFLLIEAANFLPKWLNPDTSENRIFIYQGSLHIIPMKKTFDESFPLVSGVPSLSNAVNSIRKFSHVTKASAEIQDAIKSRIKSYPHKIEEDHHRAHCYVPCAVAAILKEDLNLLSPAVKAFYLRDPIDLNACKAMKYFAPETRVMTEVIFTRCLYAQLSSQKYEPDKMTGWNLPSASSLNSKSHTLGMKLACGFEILAASVEQIMHVENTNTDHDFSNDVRWKRFLKSLKDKGYFKGEVEGTKFFNRFLFQAKEFYLSSLKSESPESINPGLRIHKLLKTVNTNYEEMKEMEKSLQPPDDDSWMNITPESLDSMLENLSHDQREPNLGEKITKGLKSFVNDVSDFEGVEAFSFNSKCKKQKINFDPDAFTEAVNTILDFRVPESNDDDGSSSSMSGYSDDEDEDFALNETQIDKRSSHKKEMTTYMDEMDRELAKTNIGLSFEKLPYTESLDKLDQDMPCDINEEEDDFQPVDVDLTALKNILESYSSQQGLPGPASSIFNSLGMTLPDDID